MDSSPLLTSLAVARCSVLFTASGAWSLSVMTGAERSWVIGRYIGCDEALQLACRAAPARRDEMAARHITVSREGPCGPPLPLRGGRTLPRPRLAGSSGRSLWRPA